MLTLGYGRWRSTRLLVRGPLLAGALTELTGVNGVAALSRLDHGRSPDAAVDRTDTSQRAAVRATTGARTDGALGNAKRQNTSP
jgi:hypothetical protein